MLRASIIAKELFEPSVREYRRLFHVNVKSANILQNSYRKTCLYNDNVVYLQC